MVRTGRQHLYPVVGSPPWAAKSRGNLFQGLIFYVDNKTRIEEVLESRSAGLNGPLF